MTTEPTQRTAATPAQGGAIGETQHDGRSGGRLTTETKSFFKTSEFLVYVGILAALFIAGIVVDGGDGGAGAAGAGGAAAGTEGDFTAQEVWLYATILTVGYMIARGLAKMGVRDPYWGDRGERPAGG